MACTSPKRAWEYGQTENGKKKLVFKRPEGVNYDPIQVPCGQCVSCKMSYAREWATRIVHQAQTSKISSFITLTYNEENLPLDKSLDKDFIRHWMRMFKQRLWRNYQVKIKYYLAGEYGSSKGHRPHYHAIIFGWDFPDKTFWDITESGSQIFRSKFLEESWTLGFSSIGDVTLQSAAYVARYTMKKQRDPSEYVDQDTGMCLQPEFNLMSPGIGKDWYKLYKSDTYKDYLNVDFQKVRVPRYYDKLMELEDPERLQEIKEKRVAKAMELLPDNSIVRRKQKDLVKKTQNNMLHRSLSHD
jgi:hypothetical protein